MSWQMSVATMDDFVERHRVLSTSPDSGFVRTPTVQRRDATGADIMRRVTVTRSVKALPQPIRSPIATSGSTRSPEVFDLRFEGVPARRSTGCGIGVSVPTANGKQPVAPDHPSRSA